MHRASPWGSNQGEPDGNAAASLLGGLACPRGAHYLPLPGPQATHVRDILADLGKNGIFIALMTTRGANDWHALGYVGVALCASGATAMLRQARDEWADVHLKAWPAEE